MSGLRVPPITEAALKLSEPMTELLGRIAGHKYAWTYVSRHNGEMQVADALVRRGLAEWGEVHGRDHRDSPQLAATEDGLALFRRAWPRSPAALERYEDSPFLATDWAEQPLPDSYTEEKTDA